MSGRTSTSRMLRKTQAAVRSGGPTRKVSGAALIFRREISWRHRYYFSVADRLRAILDNTPLPGDDHFWVFAASLPIGTFRQLDRPTL
jgi:hypothetical protein